MIYLTDCSLRKVEQSDLRIILDWRNSERIRKNMYTDHIISWEEHQAWFKKLQNSMEQEYLMFRYRSMPTGLVYFTDIDQYNEKCFWGFYLGNTDAPKGIGTVMGFLGIEHAFEYIRIRKLCGEVLAFNKGSINFHKRLGFCEEGRFIQDILKNGKYEDVIRFALFNYKWDEIKVSIKSKINLIR